jgi:hypothetical protein
MQQVSKHASASVQVDVPGSRVQEASSGLTKYIPGKRVKIPVCTDQTKEIYQYALHTRTLL